MELAGRLAISYWFEGIENEGATTWIDFDGNLFGVPFSRWLPYAFNGKEIDLSRWKGTLSGMNGGPDRIPLDEHSIMLRHTVPCSFDDDPPTKDFLEWTANSLRAMELHLADPRFLLSAPARRKLREYIRKTRRYLANPPKPGTWKYRRQRIRANRRSPRRLKPTGSLYRADYGIVLSYYYPGIDDESPSGAVIKPNEALFGVPYSQWLRFSKGMRKLHLWRWKGSLPGMVGAAKRIRVTNRSMWFRLYQIRKPVQRPGKPLTPAELRGLESWVGFLRARLADERIEFSERARRLLEKSIIQAEDYLRNPPGPLKESLGWRDRDDPLKPMLVGFNESHKMDAYELYPKLLRRKPHGEIGKDGFFCEYSLFEWNGAPVLASYCGHRMSNSHYEEIDAQGKMIYSWSCGITGDPRRRQTQRRAEAGPVRRNSCRRAMSCVRP